MTHASLLLLSNWSENRNPVDGIVAPDGSVSDCQHWAIRTNKGRLKFGTRRSVSLQLAIGERRVVAAQTMWHRLPSDVPSNSSAGMPMPLCLPCCVFLT